MGATQSVEGVANDLNDEVNNIKTELTAPILFKLNVARPEAGWQKTSTNAAYKFYNANEDTARQTRWYLEVESGDVDMLVEELAEMQIDRENKKATFYDAENQCVCSIVFPTIELSYEFSDQYHNKLFENVSTKGDVDLGNANEWFFKPAETEPMDWEPTEEPLPEPTTPKLGKQKEALKDKSAVVTGVAMGAGENSFLLQEGKVQVLKNELGAVAGTSNSFSLTPPPATGLGAVSPVFTASKVMLSKQETQMNMLTPIKREAVVQEKGPTLEGLYQSLWLLTAQIEHSLEADLESGKVVRQWNCMMNGVEVPMSDIAPDTRAAQLDHRSTFLGLDANRICRWDQRTAEGVVADLTYTHGKDYAARTNFTCMATSGDGYVAVGSKDGKVRLFGSKKAMEDYGFSRAVTAVPGLGLPITAIDVSYDAKYVVATTDKYLIVVSTSFKDAKGAATNGFVSRMGAQTPAPRLLKLKPEDRIRAGQDSLFSKGTLTWVTTSDVPERWIAASCGQFTVLWNFRKIKAHKPTVISSGAFTICDHYQMIKKDEKVVENAFLHDTHASTTQAKNALVVTTKHQVYNYLDDESSDFEG